MAVTTVTQGIYAGAALELVQSMMGEFVADLVDEARSLAESPAGDGLLAEALRLRPPPWPVINFLILGVRHRLLERGVMRPSGNRKSIFNGTGLSLETTTSA